jgi:hypothetical protein
MTEQRFRKLKLVLLTVLVGSTSFSLAVPAAPAENTRPPEVFPISEIKAGLTGTTYTVMQGTKIEPIHTEIWGVLPNAVGPGHHLIIGKLNDEKTRLTFAVHGMSGSPLYINGKIAGALSRRIAPFEKDAFCGFTPIQDMLDVEKFDSTEPPRLVGTGRTRLSSLQSWLRPIAGKEGMAFSPLLIPLTIAGLPPRAFSLWTKELADLNFLPVMGAGDVGGETTTVDGPFEPGAPLSVVLARGTFTIGGTGTLTYRNGNKVLGFGHPMLWLGKGRIPMARAEIIATVPSYLYPYKISRIGQTVGTITEDRLTAVGGEIGPAPRLIPMNVEIVTTAGKTKNYPMEILDHEMFTGSLVRSVFSSITMLSLDFTREFSMAVEAKAELHGLPAMALKDFYSGEEGERFEALLEFARNVDELLNNPIAEAKITNVTIKATLGERRREFNIEEAWINKDTAKPGETLRLHVALREFQGDRRVERFEFALPEEIKSGEVKLLVGDADAMRRAESGSSTGLTITKSDSVTIVSSTTTRENARTLQQIIARMNEARPHNFLYYRLSRTTPGQLVQNERLPSLPPSEMAVRESRRWKEGATKLSDAELFEKRVPLDGVLNGSSELTIKIE